MNGSFIAATMIGLHGTDEQRNRLLPRLASAEIRAAFSMSEPHAGSDVQSIRTTAVRDGDDYVLDGQKMWVTNAWRAGLISVLAKTDPTADPRHLGMTGFLVEETDGDAPPGLRSRCRRSASSATTASRRPSSCSTASGRRRRRYSEAKPVSGRGSSTS
jgi:butyryl-CoA dehydrogenase